ncbi:hypothetical protein ACP2W0_18400 [Pseudobacillus badius]|uniref:hypothetical protein n=1 Tax=Bacillus badius TaxID=1455 RepID=UPI003CFA605A
MRAILILIKKDFKEIINDKQGLLVIAGYLLLINGFKFFSQSMGDPGANVASLIATISAAAIIPINNVALDAFGRDRLNKVMDLLLVKVRHTTICWSKLIVSLIMALLLGFFSYMIQYISVIIFNSSSGIEMFNNFNSHLFALSLGYFFPATVFISGVGIIIAIYIRPQARMYAFLILLLLLFGAIKLMLTYPLDIFLNYNWLLPCVLWCLAILPISIIKFVVDKETMLRTS